MNLPDFVHHRTVRRTVAIAGAVLIAIAIALLLLVAFGWGMLREPIERRLSASTGRTVSIASIRRVSAVSFSPVLELSDVRVAQPAWVGAGHGDMLRLRAARIRVPVLPLLIGRVRPEALSMTGVRLALIRDAQGRANWKRDKEGPSRAGSPNLGRMSLSDAIVTIDDAKRDRHLRVDLAMDARGVRARGAGTIGGAAATLMLDGAPVATKARWPFRMRLASSVVTLAIDGTMATPLDLGHFEGAVEARGRGLRDLDRVIEAGLPDTQPFALSARVTHDRPTWRLAGLRGRIGRSDVAADLTISKSGDRTRIEGAMTSDGFDFDDLANDAQLAAGRAKAAAVGPRFFPPTRIDLGKLRRTDANVRITLRRLLFREPSAVRSISTTLVLDRGVLTAAPLRADLTKGIVTGSAIVRHPSGAPLLTLDLTLRGSRLEGVVAPPDIATGAFDARLRLSGHGETIREAIGRSDGRIGAAARDGRINRRAALIMGSDVGRALFTDKEDGTALRCLVGDFTVRGGVARPAVLVLDTAVSQARGTGSVALATERLALALRGQPKLRGGLHFDGAIEIDGTIKRPHASPPPRAATAGSVLKAIGRAIGGHDQPAVVGDANCGALAARALR